MAISCFGGQLPLRPDSTILAIYLERVKKEQQQLIYKLSDDCTKTIAQTFAKLLDIFGKEAIEVEIDRRLRQHRFTVDGKLNQAQGGSEQRLSQPYCHATVSQIFHLFFVPDLARVFCPSYANSSSSPTTQAMIWPSMLVHETIYDPARGLSHVIQQQKQERVRMLSIGNNVGALLFQIAEGIEAIQREGVRVAGHSPLFDFAVKTLSAFVSNCTNQISHMVSTSALFFDGQSSHLDVLYKVSSAITIRIHRLMVDSASKERNKIVPALFHTLSCLQKPPTMKKLKLVMSRWKTNGRWPGKELAKERASALTVTRICS